PYACSLGPSLASPPRYTPCPSWMTLLAVSQPSRGAARALARFLQARHHLSRQHVTLRIDASEESAEAPSFRNADEGWVAISRGYSRLAARFGCLGEHAL